MDDPIVIRELSLSGFRAYLETQTFNFSSKPCLAVYGPNAMGKSSLVDGVEFYLSDTGTLERLGARTANNQAGPIALKHNLAEEKGVSCSVSMTFSAGKALLSGARSGDGKRPITPAAQTVVAACAVDPIIRGYALRAFVEGESAEARYAAVAGWLNLTPLVEVQRNTRALRQQVKAACENTSAFHHVDQNLARLTAQALLSWGESAALAHLNAALKILDGALQLASLSANDPAMLKLKGRAEAEADRLGLAALKHRLGLVRALHRDPSELKNGDPVSLIAAFGNALTARDAAIKLEEMERSKAEKAVFANVWEAAQPLFTGETPPDACPVCDTPLDATKGGDAAGVALHLASHLTALEAYRSAKQALEDTTNAAKAIRLELLAAVQALVAQELPGALGEGLKAYLQKLQKGPAPAPAEVSALAQSLGDMDHALAAEIEGIEAAQGDATYAKAWMLANRLLDLKRERLLADLTKAELEKLAAELTAQATVLASQIRAAVQALLDRLNAPMNAIYEAIQGERAKPVRLQLPSEEDTNQQRLLLLIDFASNREGVQPGGYLSDSQIHSLALAFRLAAILCFNQAARFVVLDDIVTSYDASHRRALTSVIGKLLADLQVLVVTHDERFFFYLRDQLPPARWRFSRIMRLDADYGPRFSDAQVSDEAIQARWEAGLSAANEIRQAEEDWLLSICRDFGVSVQIRPLERPYSYERSELANALASFLKGRSLTPPLIPGVSNPFLQSLSSGVVENFGSHFQDNPGAQGSIGDEQARWTEFRTFRDLFQCPSCSRQRFKRGNLNKPVCLHEKCETQFAFKAAAPA
jgi:recombinational DNA repair ATPase RecF